MTYQRVLVTLVVVLCLVACDGVAGPAATVTAPPVPTNTLAPTTVPLSAPPRMLTHCEPCSTANHIDLREMDLSEYDLRDSLDCLLCANFDTLTVWPSEEWMPEGFDPEQLMELGRNPGLGVRELHERGITGRGVSIAIIDDRLLLNHHEYAGRIQMYEEMGNLVSMDYPPSTHGAGVTSIAIGETVGVAPEANLYYVAMNFAVDDTSQLYRDIASAIRLLVETNERLPEEERIRVISISRGWTRGEDGLLEVANAAREALDAGILVISCGPEQHPPYFGLSGLGRPLLADPDSFESYLPPAFESALFYATQNQLHIGDIRIPIEPRTTAGYHSTDEYAFYRQGGISWAPPYLAGLYALAAQVEPDITPEEFISLTQRTGHYVILTHIDAEIPLGPIANPAALIEALESE